MAERLTDTAIDWSAVERVADEQGVAPLMFANLKRCQAVGLPVPAEALARFRGAMFRAIKTRQRHAGWLAHVLDYVNAQNLDTMIVKGAALDIDVFHTPEHVVSLDVDLLIREHYTDLPAEVCEPIWDFNSQGPIECDFGTHHDLSIDELLPIDYDRLWADARRVEVDGRATWIMSPEDMVITACTDACRKRFFHLKNLFNLRALFDRYGGEVDWDRIARIAKAQRCTGIVYAALWAARLAVGVEVDDAALRRVRPGRVRAAVIRWFAARRSITPVTQRSIVRDKEFSLGNKRVFALSNLSLALTYCAYTPAQGWRRLRWLAQKPEQSKPGMFTEEHAQRAHKAIDVPSHLKAHGS